MEMIHFLFINKMNECSVLGNQLGAKEIKKKKIVSCFKELTHSVFRRQTFRLNFSQPHRPVWYML